MESAVTLLYWEHLGPSELNLTKIVKFLGGTIKLMKLTTEVAEHPERLKSAIPTVGCLITSAQTLAKLGGDNWRGVGRQRLLIGLAANVLVYGFQPTPGESQVLRELTSDSLVGVEPLPTGGRKISVAQDSRKVCRQFSGLSFDTIEPNTQFTFIQGTGQGACSPLISIGQRPFFVRREVQGCQWLLLASQQIADLDARVPRSASILQFFSSLVPVLMFLRCSSNNQFWHNDSPTACFIIDDPLLTRHYGFLDYQRLLELMERERFCTSIAFIPWNFSRSDRGTAKLFSAYPHRYSLCVHGCDHTGREFGTTNHLLLGEKAQQALDRMTMHRKLSGIGFDDVMVFPQGFFSTAAMKALKSCGYLAAVNSTPYPVDATEDLTLRDLLGVAVTEFSNFPLFTRHYPRSVAELAFDLFLGKPALVVEHHGFFRDGYKSLAETIAKLYSLDERLQWSNLGMICSRACLKKVADNGDIYVLFFTDRFCLRNETNRPQHYVLIRQASPGQDVRIAINGRHVDTAQETDGIKAQLSLEAGQAAEIRVEHDQRESMTVPRRKDRLYQTKVFIRRSLSEFRDNYLDKSRFLSTATHNRLTLKSK
jgi:hypothetical protein